MNLFKILSTGDGSIKEPSISAFLAYLIDPQTNGLSQPILDAMFLPFLRTSKSFQALLSETTSGLRLNSNYTYTIDLEYSVYPVERVDRRKGRSDIDVLITLTNNQDNTNYYIFIENKTSDSSFRSGQLGSQYDGLLNSGIDADHIFCLLFTPSITGKATEELDSLPTENKRIVVWSEFAINLMQNMSEIAAGDLYFSQTIMAFCEFVATNFKSYQEEVKDRKRRDYMPRGINRDCFMAIYKQMGNHEEITRLEIKTRYERELRERGWEPSATDIQTSIYIVNEPNRRNNVYKPINPAQNLFYYTQREGVKDNWLLKKVIAEFIQPDLVVYWKERREDREGFLINYPCYPLH